MAFADDLSAWRPRYEAWLEQNRPFLEVARWGDAFSGYPWLQPDDVPITSLSRPLSQAKLGLLSTAGFYLRGEQEPFRAEHYEGDSTFRLLPDGVRAADLAIAHTHYLHDAAQVDWNAVLPLDHLRDMVQQGWLGSIGPIVSISGYCTDLGALAEDSAERIAALAVAEGCDAMLLVPV